jgi:hypothetical protein
MRIRSVDSVRIRLIFTHERFGTRAPTKTGVPPGMIGSR